MGHRQIVQAKIRCHRLLFAYRMFYLNLNKNKKTPNNPEDENGLVDLIKVGFSFDLKGLRRR